MANHMDGVDERRVAGGRSEWTRSRILGASAELIARSGVESATIETIAQRAEIARQTVYNYYATRSHLLIDVARIEGTKVIRRLIARTDLDQAAPDLLVEAATTIAMVSREDTFIRLLLTDDTPQVSQDAYEFRQEAASELMELYWHSILASLAERGYLRRDPQRTLTYLAFVHFVLLAERRAGRNGLRESLRQLLRSYVVPVVIADP